MSFGEPLWFWGMAALPLILLLYVRHESRRRKLLQQLVAARLFDRLAGTVSLGRRRLRLVLLLLGLAALVTSLARPRWGYAWEESKRQGRDVIIAIDCSRSMLATDLTPNRLGRAKLAAQDLISQLPGDRVGIIAFAGTAFLQAPLTIDYGAVLNSLGELDTEIIQRGGTNIAAAITEADSAFGKGESDNRCLILFTDGEELEADAVSAALAEKDHMRIFTVGLGSADGSLIPIPGEKGGTDFVKDENGQIIKSRLDEDRLRKIAESTGGFYVHLQNGPAEMQQIVRDGLQQMKEKEIDARMTRRPIERYQWPLSAALLLFVAPSFIRERRRVPGRRATPAVARVPVASLALAALLLMRGAAGAKNSGLEAYDRQDYQGAMTDFDRQLKKRDSAALDFDLGAAAYKAGDYNKALQAFSRAMTSTDPALRAAAEYNLGNTLVQQGAVLPDKESRVRELKDALQHYDQALKVTPQNKDAEYNRDLVRRLLEEKEPPKQDQQQQQQQKDKKDKKDDQKNDQQKQQQQDQQQQKSQDKKDQDQQQQSQQNQQQQQQQQSQQQQSQGSSGQQQKQDQQAQSDPGKDNKDGKEGKDGKDGQQKPPQQQNQGKGNDKKDAKSDPSQGQQGDQQPQPQTGDGQPQPENGQPGKKHTGEIKPQGEPQPSDPAHEAALEAEAAQQGKMTEAQAKSLLESIKDDDQNVRLYKSGDHKPHGQNFRDW